VGCENSIVFIRSSRLHRLPRRSAGGAASRAPCKANFAANIVPMSGPTQSSSAATSPTRHTPSARRRSPTRLSARGRSANFWAGRTSRADHLPCRQRQPRLAGRAPPHPRHAQHAVRRDRPARARDLRALRTALQHQAVRFRGQRDPPQRRPWLAHLSRNHRHRHQTTRALASLCVRKFDPAGNRRALGPRPGFCTLRHPTGGTDAPRLPAGRIKAHHACSRAPTPAGELTAFLGLLAQSCDSKRWM
jgi:hypothetical protein